MYPLGHVTFACGAVWLGARLLDRARQGETVQQSVAAGPAQATPGEDTTRRSSIADAVDYRLVALGALLPDLIDKPLNWFIIGDALNNNGHLFGHTLLFALTILLPGIYLLVSRNDPRLLAVGVAVLSHFAGDPVTHAPRILLWPLLGVEFSRVSLLGPWGIPVETAAGLILLLVARRVALRGRLHVLLLDGRL